MKSLVAAFKDLCKVSEVPTAKKQRTGDEGVPLKLTPTLWENIGKRLQCRSDVLNFRSTCRIWRSSLPPPSRFPLIVPPPPDSNSGDQDSYFISEVTFYAVNQMMVALKEVDPGGVFSSDAFVQRRQHNEWSKLMLPAKSLSRLSFLSSAYHLRVSRRNRFGTKGESSSAVLKIVIVSPTNPNYAGERDVTIVAHLAAGKKLASLRLSKMDWETDFCSLVFEDVINYRGNLFAVDKWGRVYVMDSESLHMSKIASALPNYDGESKCGRELHLVVVTDELYLLIEDQNKDDWEIWKVYKLRLGDWKWVEVEDLEEMGDQVFVMGVHCNFTAARNLIFGRNGMMSMFNKGPRFCAWPEFDFRRLHFKVVDEWESPMSSRSRDDTSWICPRQQPFYLW